MQFLPSLRLSPAAALRDATSPSPEARLRAAEALDVPSMGAPALEALLVLAADALGPVRAAAVASLADAGPAARESVLGAFEDPDTTVRQAAVLAAGEIGGREVLARIESTLADERPEMRFQAASAWVALGGAPEALRPLTRDEDPEVRAQAAQALGALGDEAGRGHVGGLLDDPHPKVRLEAALALSLLDDARGAPELEAALDDPLRAVDAAEALGRLGAGREALARRAGAPFLGPLHRAAFGAALARMGDPRGVPALRRALRAFRPDGRDYAVAVVAELQLTDLADELVRLEGRPRGADPEGLADALGRLRTPMKSLDRGPTPRKIPAPSAGSPP